VLNASADSYRDERTLKRRDFYLCGYSGDRIEEPCHRALLKAVWWLRYRERLSKADVWLVARHGGFSAFSRIFWLKDSKNTVQKTFKRAWRASGRPQETWSTPKPRGTRWRRRRPDEPLYSRRSDWLAVWNFLVANPGLSHRQLRERQAGLRGRYVHLRLQAALAHLEALELIDVTRGGNGKANSYAVHRAPFVPSSDRAFTKVLGHSRNEDHSHDPAVVRWSEVAPRASASPPLTVPRVRVLTAAG
jgi:hypothetical protein